MCMARMVLLRETVCVHGQNGFTEGGSVYMATIVLLRETVCTGPEWFY